MTESITPLGMASCAASACHGATEGFGQPLHPQSWKNAAVSWRAADPHASAFAVLSSSLGQQIMDRLRRADASVPQSATQYDRCLVCHSNPTLASPGAYGLPVEELTRLRSEGVSCESCHGNAGPYWAAHTSPAVTHPPPGMTDLNTIGQRAVVCAGCHVGAPANPSEGIASPRDMNHDMIAAGHPRLHFELTEYQRQLPPHWLERDRTRPDRPARDSWFEMQTWLVGRVAVAEAACLLLADRTHRAWPEFAEGNCFACHHNLQPDGWRVDRSIREWTHRKPGTLPWQSIWPITEPRFLTRDDTFEPAVAAVQTMIQSFQNQHRTSPTEMFRLAMDAANQLAELRHILSQTSAVTPAILSNLDETTINRMNWDDAAQFYLGLSAAARCQGPPYDPRFDTLRKLLQLPATSNSPDNYHPQYIQTLLLELSQSFAKPIDTKRGY